MSSYTYALVRLRHSAISPPKTLVGRRGFCATACVLQTVATETQRILLELELTDDEQLVLGTGTETTATQKGEKTSEETVCATIEPTEAEGA